MLVQHRQLKKKKILHRRRDQVCEKASKSELNEWASFQLESIHVSIDFSVWNGNWEILCAQVCSDN